MHLPIDLRSDTVTRPTAGMLAAMARAEVGDDVFGEDPTIRALEERVAHLLGMESAVFVPSGTMANQIAIKIHTRPGDEILCESTAHIFLWEAGGPAAISGVLVRTLDGEHGVLKKSQLVGQIRPVVDYYPRTRLVSLENTHNRGGGRVYPQHEVEAISSWARSNGLAMHLDGARIWNASVASGATLQELCRPFDTVAVCFSKGLGAPVGSALAGNREMILMARRARKMLGGGMRQAGYLAAAAIYALDHHVDRLRDDHHNAQTIASAIRDCPGLRLVPEQVETNLVWFEVGPELGSATTISDRLRDKGVWAHASGPTTLRVCTHLDVSARQAEYAAEQVRLICRT